MRTTKRLAKEKITALHQGEGNNEGMHPALYRLVQKSTKEPSISIALSDCGSEDGCSHHGSQDYGSEDNGSRQESNQMKVKETSNQKRIRSAKAMLSPRCRRNPKQSKKTANGAVTFTIESVLDTWSETTDYGKSFRLMDKDKQSAEVGLLNKGSAKSMKTIIKTKLINLNYQKVVDEKFRQYLTDGRVSQASMFRCPTKSLNTARASLKFLSVGEWVEVDGDRTPGFNSEGGIGVITSVHDDFADVK